MDFSHVQKAIQDGRHDVVTAWLSDPLVDINVDVDGQFGATALHWACHYAREDTAQLLVGRGAKPNIPNASQATPLHWACKTGNRALVKLLLAHRADPTLKTINDDTPMSIATQEGHAGVLDILLGKDSTSIASPAYQSQRPQVSVLLGANRLPEITEASSPVSMRDEPSSMYNHATANSSSSAVSSVPKSNALAMNGGHSHSAMQTLQRSKQKAELDLKNAQKMVETLQKECNDLQLQKLQLSAKVQASAETLAKVEVLQTEKIRLDIALRQAEAELGRLKKEQSGDTRASSQDQQEALNKLLKEKKDALTEAHRLKEMMEVQRQTSQQTQMRQDVEIDELRAEVNELQVQKVRSEMQLRELSELKSMISELQRAKALLELELAGKEELHRQFEGLQAEKFAVESELRDAVRQGTELHGVIGTLKRQIEGLETELVAFKEIKSQLDQERREKARLEIHAQTLQEELDARKELALNAIRGTEDAVGSMQNNLKALREEKTQLKQELQQHREQVSQLNQALMDMQKSTEGQTSRNQEVDILQASLQAVEHEKKIQEEALRTLRQSYDELSQQQMEMQKQKVVVDVEIEELRKAKSQLAIMEEEKLQLAMDLKRATLTAENKAGALEKISAEHQFMEEQLQLLEGMRDANSRLERDHAATEEKLRHMQVEMDKLSGDRTYWESQWNLSHAKERADLQGKLGAMEKEVHRLQSELKAVVDQLVQAQTTIANLTDTKVAMEAATIQQLRTRVAELQREKSTLETQSHQHQHAQEQLQKLAELQDRLEAKDREIRDQNLVINDLKNRLKAVQDTLSSERRQSQNQIEQLKQSFVSEERRNRQAYQQELDQLHAAFENESEGLRQRSAIMDRERQALEMQIRALQEQATLAVQNATKRPLFDQAAMSSRFEPRSLEQTSKMMDRFAITEAKTLSPFAERSSPIGDLKHSVTLPPLGSSLTALEIGPVQRKQMPRASNFAREQRALLKGGLY